LDIEIEDIWGYFWIAACWCIYLALVDAGGSYNIFLVDDNWFVGVDWFIEFIDLGCCEWEGWGWFEDISEIDVDGW